MMEMKMNGSMTEQLMVPMDQSINKKKKNKPDREIPYPVKH